MDYIAVRTRSGNKVHLAHAGSSGTVCGVWLKTSAANRRTSGKINCDRCASVMPRTVERINEAAQ